MHIETGTATVRAQRVDGVGIITLHRPERRNALHVDMFDAVPRLLERFIGDPEVGCIMITGAGTAFCSGGDVGGGGSRRPAPPHDDPGSGRSVEDLGTMLARDARMVELLHGSPKVTLAALPGAAVGAGMSIALAADLRIASRSAMLIPGWGQLGFSGDFGGTWFLTRLVGPAKALEILLDDRPVGAEEALGLGLFNRLAPESELPAAALGWAVAIAAAPRIATRFMKENVQQAERLTLADALPLESERMARSALTEDHKRAVARWLEAARAKREGRGGLSG
jgi:2-(1,2-epoxy-1,2-dihydrophenyl)acetyl-CoA isomerase